MSTVKSSCRRIATALIASAALVGPVLVGPPAQAAEEIRIDPGLLPRGADLRVPHVEGNDVIDGATRITIKAGSVQSVAKLNDGYAVLAQSADASRLLRVTSSKQIEIARADSITDFRVNEDRSKIAYTVASIDRTQVRVIDSATGKLLAQRGMSGSRNLVGIQGASVFVASPGTYRWYYQANRLVKVTDRITTASNLGRGLIAGYDRRGCNAVLRLGALDRPLWQSCGEMVTAINPAGTRMATANTDIYSNGEISHLRGINGGLQATYRLKWGYTYDTVFESDATIVMRAVGFSWQTWARGWPTGANRAAELSESPGD